MPKRAYLDHKDYVSMAKGLRGHSDFLAHADAYHTLKQYVEKGDLICYFSAVHLLEALRYENTDRDVIESYCEVLDTLTRGKCIVWQEILERRELTYFIATRFNIPMTLQKDGFPYGDYLEAFVDPSEAFSDWSKQYGKSRNERRLLLKELSKLSEIECSRIVDGALKSMPPELEDVFTPELLVEIFKGSAASKPQVIRHIMEKALRFKKLLSFWRYMYPDLQKLGHHFDGSANNMIGLIGTDRGFSEAFGKGVYQIDLDELRKSLVIKTAKHFSTKIHQLLKDGGVTRKELEAALIGSDMRGMPSWDAAISVFLEYLRDNKGSSNRRVVESDLRDILHLRYLPYADYFVTDRYFGEIARRLKHRFSTVILENVQQLTKHLERDLALMS